LLIDPAKGHLEMTLEASLTEQATDPE